MPNYFRPIFILFLYFEHLKKLIVKTVFKYALHFWNEIKTTFLFILFLNLRHFTNVKVMKKLYFWILI